MLLTTTALFLAAAVQMTGDSGETGAEASARVSTVSPIAADSVEYDGSSLELEIAAVHALDPEIRVDGHLDDPAWARAPVLSGFTQYDPSEGIPASQDTEVRVLVTGDAVLFGVRAFDREAGGVRSTLAHRDGFGDSDDYVRILLDTFHDQRRAFVFQVNPLGIQGDGLWVEGRDGRGDPIDWNPDFLWESVGQVLDDGYSVELKVPLKSLRFPEAPVQDWGLQVVRRIQRTGFQSSWAPLTGEVTNKLAQAGTLRNLEGLEPGRFVEINPVLTATRQGSWDSERDRFHRDGATGEFGFNAAYGITSNLTLDATYNPDFSQVEADAGQIAVNERFALFFPEKRPFFLEGSDVFSMPQQLVYTRSIVNPVGAAKLSGKVGSFNLAYIGAVDEVHEGADNPVVNLLRVKGDVGESSTLGMVYTDRTLSGEQFNRVFGADGRFVLARRYTLQVMAAGSADRQPGAETQWGSMFLAEFDRASRSLTLNATFEDVGEGFRARSGFLRRLGVTRAQARTGYTFRGEPGALLESWGPSAEIQGYWNRSDFWAGSGPEEAEAQLSFRAFFRGNVGTFLTYSRTAFDFSPRIYDGLFLPGSTLGDLTPFRPPQALFGGLDAVRLRAWLSSWERMRISLGGSWSETPIFTSGVAADVGESWSGDLGLNLHPTGALSAEVGLRHVTILRRRDGSTYSSATIPRLQARYQFSRALFLRAIGEYSNQERRSLLDPVSGVPVYSCGDECAALAGSDQHDFRLEGLLGYEPSPGTVVYLGYSRQMRDTDSFRFRGMNTRADGLFLKVSYRFRM
jgi:hypothetical protein